MRTGELSLFKYLAVSVPAVWIASLLCFYFLDFRQGLLLRVLGPPLAFLIAGLAYPLVVAFPLSRLVSKRPPKHFIIAFFILLVLAIALLGLFFTIGGGLVGAYGGGMLALCFFGPAISYYLNPRAKFVLIGLLLACWTFVGDYTGYNTKSLLGGSRGVMAYASIYSIFLGSGLGMILWHVQRSDK